MSATKELVRKEIEIPSVRDPLGEEKQALIRKAKELLHYDIGSTVLRDVVKQKSARESTIEAAAAFKKVGLEPYSKESVEAYKKKVLGHKRVWAAINNFWMSNGGLATNIFVAAVGIISVFVAAGMAPDNMKNIPPHIKEVFRTGISLIFTAIGVGIWRVVTDRTKVRYYWNMIRLGKDYDGRYEKGYEGEIPEFALAHAVALKEVAPSATFYIDNFVKESWRDPKVIDPFLVMMIGSESFYVDVWNEAKFEGRKIA